MRRSRIPASGLRLRALIAALALVVGAALPCQEPAARLRVVDEQGASVAGAVVSRLEADGSLSPLGVTDSAGRFAGSPPDGSYLHIAAPKLCSVLGGRTAPTALRDLVPDAVEPVVLERGFALFGRVRDQRGEPVAGARVQARDIMSTPWSNWSPYVTAVSDARGIFALRGVPRHCMRLTLHAEGYRSATLAPAILGTPLEFELERAPEIAGKVLDQDGRPVAADVQIRYEGHDELQRARSGADGTFRATWRHAAFCRVVARRGDPVAEFCSSEVLREPTGQLELRLQPLSALPMLRVRATGADGQPLRDFEAVVLRGFGVEDTPHGYLYQQLLWRGVAAREGLAYLPLGSADQQGLLVLRAPGRALTVVDIEWKPGADGSMDLTVATAPPARLSGVVTSASGAPLAGARVWALRALKTTWEWTPSAFDAEVVVTDADGRFALGGLAAGAHDVYVARAALPERKPRRVTLVAGVEERGFELELPDVVTAAGQVEGARSGWRVGFSPWSNRSKMLAVEPPLRSAAGIRADGTFSMSEVPVGRHMLQLLVPRSSLRGGWLRVSQGVRRISSDGESELEVDADLDGPSLLRGRVERRGVQPPYERLLVQERVPPIEVAGRTNFYPWKTTAPVAGDGSFELWVAPGQHELRVVDVATGIVLKELGEPLLVDDDEVQAPALVLEVAELELSFEADVVREEGPCDGLEYRWLGNADEDALGMDFAFGTTPGLDPRDSLTTQVLYVPAGRGEFVVRSKRLSDRELPVEDEFFNQGWELTSRGDRFPYKARAGERVELRVDVPRRTFR